MADADIKTLEAEQSSWAQTGKDLASGAAGGIAQVLLGEFLPNQAVVRDIWKHQRAWIEMRIYACSAGTTWARMGIE